MNRLMCFLYLLVVSSVSVWGQLHPPLPEPLQLPPGLEQDVDLVPNSSYFGDALRGVHCPADADNPFGTCGNLLFSGLAMTEARLDGAIHIKFFPPVKDVSHFEVTVSGGLAGEDGILVAPHLLKFPVEFNRVLESDDVFIRGDLDLNTGVVTNLEASLRLINTAILALAHVNPALDPPVIEFPGIRGSASAQFRQRPDGKLDFEFYGTTFLALGNDIGGTFPRFPLQFCNAELDCASIPAAGTALHPHLRLSTLSLVESEPCTADCPDIPTNTIWEFTTYTHNSSFGDDFHLNIPELGGDALGRSHLLGRVQIQFGEKFGNSVPISVRSMPPEGLLAEPPETPLSFPGLSVGLLGHNEFLEFPDATYFLDGVAFADEPFDLPLGVVDLDTGEVVGDLLYRGFIAQDLIFVLLAQNDGRIEPNSFFFSGPASLKKGPNEETIFRFDGDVRIDFESFRFPSPDFVKANSFVAGEGAFLRPFLRIQAMHTPEPSRGVLSDSGSRLASTGDHFSFSYSIPCDPVGQPSSFEYTNSSGPSDTDRMRGTFRMHTLVAVSCTNSPDSSLPPGESDTVTFSGFGTWSEDSLPHLATAQFSQSPTEPYISIILDGGTLSTVNTRPEEIDDTIP